jgi:hypothetical protein
MLRRSTMLTEQTGYKLDVLPDGRMKVHKMVYVMKDGVKVSEVYGEYTDYEPGQFDAAVEVSKAAAVMSSSQKAKTDYESLIQRRAKKLAGGSIEDKYQAILLLKGIGG